MLGIQLPRWEDIETDMLEAGFSKQHAYQIRSTKDHSDADESLLYFYQPLIDRPITLDELRSSITAVSPGGVTENSSNPFVSL